MPSSVRKVTGLGQAVRRKSPLQVMERCKDFTLENPQSMNCVSRLVLKLRFEADDALLERGRHAEQAPGALLRRHRLGGRADETDTSLEHV